MVMVMVMVVVMRMAVVMRVGMIMMMVAGVIVMVLMTLCSHWRLYPVVVVMDIPLMVIVVVNDQGALRALLVVMVMMGVMSMMMVVLVAMLMNVFMVMIVVVVGMVVIIFMAGDPRLAASAYATHINLPRCR
ncbi:hypothetical protein [Aeromonas rivipollensis]|uniref:hypothetical protein n=1 Tax=Aeromonas rivipollensis TaxID=948519 RepID=UPI0027D93780|nr:hypothetical protein [uncultured Aeromonas sp.]MDU1141583.1 hypothetical protein [Aeromonas hydrophila]